ncbi:hypothetical protein FB45DRAFT_916719 [Roridomyces roridus]|uniref:DUF866-domain-containing protein n=1 Tax=Roridomyces roridus TaxID=1738132 RepID=A0AAD7FPC5_9AGAR|nr:hypothetical protein FB45DRAFT_916719 [Roridomyces roridus]
MKLLLEIKAELENITSLEPLDNNFTFFFQVQCTSCREVHPGWVTVNRHEQVELSGSKGATAHFVWRCKFCKRESSAKFVEAYPFRSYESENAQFEPLLQIECRGLEFVGFDPRGIWKCKGTTGTVFPEVDLTEGEWNDYDEKAALPVSVSDIESRWGKA